MIRLAIFVFLVIVVYKLLSGLLKGFGALEKQEVAGEQIEAVRCLHSSGTGSYRQGGWQDLPFLQRKL
jgi:hypothetical protein